MENRTDGVGAAKAKPWSFTRVGDADLLKKPDVGVEQKLELVDDANDDTSFSAAGVKNRPDGESERCMLDLIDDFLEELDI